MTYVCIVNQLIMYVVHLRKRKSEHGKLKSPSTSSITYWQIEKDKEPLSGMMHMQLSEKRLSL